MEQGPFERRKFEIPSSAGVIIQVTSRALFSADTEGKEERMRELRQIFIGGGGGS